MYICVLENADYVECSRMIVCAATPNAPSSLSKIPRSACARYSSLDLDRRILVVAITMLMIYAFHIHIHTYKHIHNTYIHTYLHTLYLCVLLKNEMKECVYTSLLDVHISNIWIHYR